MDELAQKWNRLLPPLHRQALELVLAQNQPIYLVGGIVRDLILGRANLDLDFVCLKPAKLIVSGLLPHFENEFGKSNLKLLEHAAFGTIRLDVGDDDLHLDFATARQEVYSQPAALPTVRFTDNLSHDLGRRDFTINAIAYSVQTGLHDPFGGLADLQNGLLRILHSHSFEDDPTRMIRAIRFAARLDYALEPFTLTALQKALDDGYFQELSAERKRNELRMILKEAEPTKALALLQNYNLLTAIHPLLAWNEALQKVFERVKVFFKGNPPAYALLAALLHLGDASMVVNELRFANLEADVPIEVVRLWQNVYPKLNKVLPNSQLYRLLNPYKPESLAVFEALASERGQIAHYQQNLALRRPLLNGNDVIRLGVPAGPRIKELLGALQDAVLDGRVMGREAEEAFLYAQINKN